MSLLGVEVGGGGATAIACDAEGRVLGRGTHEYVPNHPREGWAEIPIDAVWDGLKFAVGMALADVRDPVTAMSLAVTGQAVVPVARDGRALGPSMMPFDRRGETQTHDLREMRSPLEIMRITGSPIGANFTLPKLMWLKQNDPGTFRETWQFMGWQEYLVYRLGFEPTTDYSLAGRTMMFDVINKDWSSEILDLVEIDRETLCGVRPAGTLLGEISRSAADELGLPHGTKLVLGGFDQAMGALAAGAVLDSHAMDATGTVEVLVPAFNEPVVDAGMLKNGFVCCPHVVPDAYISVAYNFTGGSLLRWYRDTLGHEEKAIAEKTGRSVYDVIMECMDDEPTTALVLPYFSASGTPYFESKPMGGIVGLDLSSTRGTLIRALLEGVTFEIRLNMALLAESGVRVNVIHAVGGAARSREWCQLKADVFGLSVMRHADVDAPAQGAAMLAGAGVDVYEDLHEAVAACVKPREEIRPDGERAEVYNHKFARYRKLYPALRQVLG